MRLSLLPILFFIFSLGLPAIALSAEKSDLPAGFIAMSESKMNWTDAVAYCKQKGGKLPRINNRDSWQGGSGNYPIDGFGSSGAPWPSGLSGDYWSGTVDSGKPPVAWVIYDSGGKVVEAAVEQSIPNRVVCVP